MLVDLSLAAFVMGQQHGRHAIAIWISRDWLHTLHPTILNCIQH